MAAGADLRHRWLGFPDLSGVFNSRMSQPFLSLYRYFQRISLRIHHIGQGFWSPLRSPVATFKAHKSAAKPLPILTRNASHSAKPCSISAGYKPQKERACLTAGVTSATSQLGGIAARIGQECWIQTSNLTLRVGALSN